MSVTDMRKKLTFKEYLGWHSFLSEPDIQEVQMATLTAMLSQANGGKGKAEDFLISKNINIGDDDKRGNIFDSFNAVASDMK